MFSFCIKIRLTNFSLNFVSLADAAIC